VVRGDFVKNRERRKKDSCNFILLTFFYVSLNEYRSNHFCYMETLDVIYSILSLSFIFQKPFSSIENLRKNHVIIIIIIILSLREIQVHGRLTVSVKSSQHSPVDMDGHKLRVDIHIFTSYVWGYKLKFKVFRNFSI